jgi:MIT (microtubule interacting and transport) domain
MSDCNVLVASAIAADQAKEYETAMALYRTATSMLLAELEMKRGTAQQRQHLKQRVKELLGRAEELKRYLDKVKSRYARSPSTRLTSDKAVRQLAPGKKTTTLQPKQDEHWTQGHKVNERHDNQGILDADRDREWSFHFDLRFDMQSKIKTPSPLPEDKHEKGPFNIMNLLRFLPLGGQ